MALGRDPRETDIEYVHRCLKRAAESRARADACDRMNTALNYKLETKRPVISVVTKIKAWWQIPGGYHPETETEFPLDYEELVLLRTFLQQEKNTALNAAKAYEHDATHVTVLDEPE